MVTMQPQAITKVSISALLISLPIIIYVSLLRVPPSALARDSTFWFLISNSIIAIIAADSGVLFLSNDDDDDDEPVATVDYYRDTMPVPLMPTSHEQTVPAGVVGGEQLMPIGGAASSKATDSTGGMEEGHALALIEREGAAGKPGTDILVVNHASVLQRFEEEPAAAAPEPEQSGGNKNDATIVEGDHCTTSPAPRTAVTPDDDVLQYEVKPAGCSVAEESKPPPRQEEEQREYWQLSDEELNRKVEEFIARFNRDMIEQEAAAI